jgi:hypothetical protein
MDYDTYAARTGDGCVVRWLCVVTTDHQEFVGCGMTEESAVLDALDKAAVEDTEARFELGVMLGMRGGQKGGRPYGS